MLPSQTDAAKQLNAPQILLNQQLVLQRWNMLVGLPFLIAIHARRGLAQHFNQ
jgi:hypothetical protein